MSERENEAKSYDAELVQRLRSIGGRNVVLNARVTEDCAKAADEIERLWGLVQEHWGHYNDALEQWNEEITLRQKAEADARWLREGVEKLNAHLLLINRILATPPEATYEEVKVLEPGKARWDCMTIDLWNAKANSVAKSTRNKLLRSALRGLSHENGPDGPCFCGMAIGHPLAHGHSAACLAARAALEGNPPKETGDEDPS